MNKFNQLAERIKSAMAGRMHEVFVVSDENCIAVTNINVPMLADIRMIAEEYGASVYPNHSWDIVEIEL